MPTARRRHAITESDELARVLDAMEHELPGESRSRLLHRLLDAGVQATMERNADVIERRRTEILAGASLMPSGIYRANERELLLAEWPE